MSYFKMFEDFPRELSSQKPMTSTIKKSLEAIGKSFKDEESIVKSIELLGWKKIDTSKSSTAEYAFKNPNNDNVYISYTTGYVRASIIPSTYRWTKKGTRWITPISKFHIPTTRERLLIIFRRALKSDDLYKMWLKSVNSLDAQDPVTDFFEKKKGQLLGRKYGI